MNEETLAILGEAAMLDGTSELLPALRALSEKIDRVASSGQTVETEGPVMLQSRKAETLRGDEGTDATNETGASLLSGSERWEEPYVSVPRVV